MAGHANGTHVSMQFDRFADLPSEIDIPVHDDDGEEFVNFPLDDSLSDDTTDICILLENERVARSYWITIAFAYARQHRLENAIEVLTHGLGAPGIDSKGDRANLLSALCWMYMWKAREAPQLLSAAESGHQQRPKTKQDYIASANVKLNELTRLSPLFPTLQLARGTLSLLKASVVSKSVDLAVADRERSDNLRIAMTCFEATLKATKNRNIYALLGKARVHYSLFDYPAALKIYQDILQQVPSLRDPDPRIGIGCCYWQLGFRDDAKVAWERALEINPFSEQANLLLGIYWTYTSSQYAPTHAEFIKAYRKGIGLYTHKAFELNQNLPLACTTLAGYLQTKLSRGSVEKLARRAIDCTDLNAISSDGWYLLARNAHAVGDLSNAQNYYDKSDQARGGDKNGYLPAKFGTAQIKVLQNDLEGAKFKLQNICSHSKSVHAQTFLGTLLAESIFVAKNTATINEDVASQRQKAISLLEAVRATWRDTKNTNSPPNISVLLVLARIYETESPEKSLGCLKEVEDLELRRISGREDENGIHMLNDNAGALKAKRECLPVQLLSNLGCFHYSLDRLAEARDYFEMALNACAQTKNKGSANPHHVDMDAAVTTISYNLGRTYEAQGLMTEAKAVYEGLVDRQDNYNDAMARLAVLGLQHDADQSVKDVKALFGRKPDDMPIRTLYSWFLNRTKRKNLNVREDVEQKLGKVTLTTFDKYDQYTLTGIANIWLTAARELRKGEDKAKLRKSYYKQAMDIFAFALQHDSGNAYAAQGVAIVLAEDKQDLAQASSILSSLRDTLKDFTVYLNLGHIFCEMKQFKKAIENYELALEKKDRLSEVAVLSALGRAWYYRGLQERSIAAFQESLKYSNHALEKDTEQLYHQFNVAFVQEVIARHLSGMAVTERTVEDLEAASMGLKSAINVFVKLSKHEHPPYEPVQLEQRANMGKTLLNNGLERALVEQRTFVEQNSARLAAARGARAAEAQKREEEKAKREAEAEARRARLLKERLEREEQDRFTRERLAAEERRREEAELTTDSETGEKRRRGKSKRLGGGGGGGRRKRQRTEERDIVSDSHLSQDEGTGWEHSDRDGGNGVTKPAKAKSKKARVVREVKKMTGKFKSANRIEDSDEEARTMNGSSKDSQDGGEVRQSSMKLSPAAESREADDGDQDDGMEIDD